MIATGEKLEKYFERFLNFEKVPDKRMFKLDTMQEMVEFFGHPEREFEVVHVAGSKGKGSTVAMIAAILDEETDKKVGMFMSPHVVDFRERVTSSRGFFEDKIYKKALEQLRKGVSKLSVEKPELFGRLTWFEAVTMYSFLVFKEAGVKWAVYEVGMGGRLDATNVVSPKVTALTNVELEHTEFLGDTVEKIAMEKVGIAKKGVIMVLGEMDSEAQKVAKREVMRKGAMLALAEVCDFDVDFELPMAGKQQVLNARLAAAVVKMAVKGIKDETIRRGLAGMRALPGRFEVIEVNGRKVVMDVAHTESSVRYAVENFERECWGAACACDADLLFSLAADKDAEKIVPLLKGKFRRIYVTRPGDFKKADLRRLERAFEVNGMKIDMMSEDYEKVIREALFGSRDALLFVLGSFYLVGEVKKVISVI